MTKYYYKTKKQILDLGFTEQQINDAMKGNVEQLQKELQKTEALAVFYRFIINRILLEIERKNGLNIRPGTVGRPLAEETKTRIDTIINESKK